MISLAGNGGRRQARDCSAARNSGRRGRCTQSLILPCLIARYRGVAFGMAVTIRWRPPKIRRIIVFCHADAMQKNPFCMATIVALHFCRYLLDFWARPEGFEPPTPKFVVWCAWAYAELIESLVIKLRERRRRGRRHIVRYFTLKIVRDHADKSGLIWSGCEQTGRHEKVFTKIAACNGTE